MKKIFVKTFGCQMNVADSEYIVSLLMSSGDFEMTKDINKADVIIVNTCSVRQHAENRAEAFIGQIKKLKIKNEKLKIIVIGCFAQSAKLKLQKKFNFIDIICGPLEYEYLPEILQKEFNFLLSDYKKHINIFNKLSVFIPIMTGCDNYCSYCIVPYVRGREKSRPLDEILYEVKNLLDSGVKEITLIGQNVNSYKFQYNNLYIGFSELLEKVVNLESEKKFWVRFLTNHPKDMNYDIVKVIKTFPNITRHIHLPLQSGSNRILELMNRKYTVEKYKEIIQMIRDEIKDIAITTDLIVGFPTEKEEDFEQTLKTVEEIKFDSAFVFKYSPREKTKAAELPDDVSREIKEQRHYKLLTLCDNIAYQKNKSYINKIKEVLVFSSVKDKNILIGKTIENKTVEIIFSNKDLIGNFVKVKIKDVKFHTLIGEVLV